MNPDTSSDKQAFNPAQPAAPTLPKPATPPEPSLPAEPTRPTAPSLDSAIPAPDPSQVTPVASAIGEIASQPEVDTNAIPNPTASEPTAAPAGSQPIPNGPNAAPPTTPDAVASADNPPHTDSKTVKLPVPTSVLPALAIGALVLILLLAVAAYAFLG